MLGSSEVDTVFGYNQAPAVPAPRGAFSLSGSARQWLPCSARNISAGHENKWGSVGAQFLHDWQHCRATERTGIGVEWVLNAVGIVLLSPKHNPLRVCYHELSAGRLEPNWYNDMADGTEPVAR